MKEYHIFISHAWKYSEHYKKIVEWLNEAQEEGILKWKNYSVPEHDPLIDPDTVVGKNTLKEMLKKQISPAVKVIILSGMYVAYSDWISYEIDTAVDYKKNIIGVRPWGQERVPEKVVANADVMIGWTKKSLIEAVINS